jgi:uncharacterized protein
MRRGGGEAAGRVRLIRAPIGGQTGGARCIGHASSVGTCSTLRAWTRGRRQVRRRVLPSYAGTESFGAMCGSRRKSEPHGRGRPGAAEPPGARGHGWPAIFQSPALCGPRIEWRTRRPCPVAARPTGVTDETQANREAVRAAFEAWQAGTAPITDLFAPDMVWRIEGHSVASREYGSRQEFVDAVLAPFAARFADGEPFRPVRIRSIHADADTVIVVWDGRGVANDGRPYENSYAWVNAHARRQGRRRDGVLRQHLVQRPLGARPGALSRGRGSVFAWPAPRASTAARMLRFIAERARRRVAEARAAHGRSVRSSRGATCPARGSAASDPAACGPAVQKPMRITTRRSVGRPTSARPASANTRSVPTWSSSAITFFVLMG